MASTQTINAITQMSLAMRHAENIEYYHHASNKARVHVVVNGRYAAETYNITDSRLRHAEDLAAAVTDVMTTPGKRTVCTFGDYLIHG